MKFKRILFQIGEFSPNVDQFEVDSTQFQSNSSKTALTSLQFLWKWSRLRSIFNATEVNTIKFRLKSSQIASNVHQTKPTQAKYPPKMNEIGDNSTKLKPVLPTSSWNEQKHSPDFRQFKRNSLLKKSTKFHRGSRSIPLHPGSISSYWNRRKKIHKTGTKCKPSPRNS